MLGISKPQELSGFLWELVIPELNCNFMNGDGTFKIRQIAYAPEPSTLAAGQARETSGFLRVIGFRQFDRLLFISYGSAEMG